MSELPLPNPPKNGEQSLNDIAHRTRRPEWKQADRIMTEYRRSLCRTYEGHTPYAVSPSVTEKIADEKLKFAVAALMDGNSILHARYLVINDGLDQPVEIAEYADSTGSLYDQSGTPVNADKLSTILDSIEKLAKAQQSDSINWRSVILNTAIVVLLLGFAIWGVSSCMDSEHEARKQHDAEKVAAIKAFDDQHVVLQGQRFDRGMHGFARGGTKANLVTDVPEGGTASRNLRQTTLRNVEGQDGCVNFGYLAEDEHLTVKVEAPDDKTIEVFADKLGAITMCARDKITKLEYVSRGIDRGVGPWHIIQMQIQPN